MKASRGTTLRAGGALISQEELTFDASVREEAKKSYSPTRLKRVLDIAKSVRVRRIAYRSNGHAVNGYIVEPRRIRGKLPCIVWNRGGSLEFGMITNVQAFALLGMFASWGYIVIASQYSGNDGSEGRDNHGGTDVQDVLVLPNVLKRHAHADLSHIGMFGGSRGGMMTYLCMKRAPWIRAAVTVAGLANLVRQVQLRPKMKGTYAKMFRVTPTELRKRSATHWASRFPKHVPLLMLHGTADWRVSPLDSLELSAELIKHNVHHRLVMFENDDHDLSAHRKEKWNMTREWFDTHLKTTR